VDTVFESREAPGEILEGFQVFEQRPALRVVGIGRPGVLGRGGGHHLEVTIRKPFHDPLECPTPDAIAINNPKRPGLWDWTDELKSALTRLGYEKSGTTITMVGMTPPGIMREWTLVQSNGSWTCDSASAEELEDILFILEKIDAISGYPVAAPVAAVTEKTSLSSSRDLVPGTLNARIQPEYTTTPASLLTAKKPALNEIDMNIVKSVNSSAVQKSNILSGQLSPASISDRKELLSRSETTTERKPLVSIKAAGAFQIGSQVRARGEVSPFLPPCCFVQGY